MWCCVSLTWESECCVIIPWFGQWLVFWWRVLPRHDNLFRTTPRGTLEGGQRRGRQRKFWVDNINEWTSLPVSNLSRVLIQKKKKEKKNSAGINEFSSFRPFDRFGHREDMTDDSAEILFHRFLQEATVSSSGIKKKKRKKSTRLIATRWTTAQKAGGCGQAAMRHPSRACFTGPL